jgi:hypothetical protein
MGVELIAVIALHSTARRYELMLDFTFTLLLLLLLFQKICILLALRRSAQEKPKNRNFKNERRRNFDSCA